MTFARLDEFGGVLIVHETIHVFFAVIEVLLIVIAVEVLALFGLLPLSFGVIIIVDLR
jgi:hypothetical protein